MQDPYRLVTMRTAPEPVVKTTTVTKTIEPLIIEQQGGLVRKIVDKGNYVFLMFMMFGFGALLPWNMFLNISYDYYTNHKLLDENKNGTLESAVFQNSMTIAAQIPNLIFSILNIFLTSTGDFTLRMRICLAVVQAMVLITISFIYVYTHSWTTWFFFLTISNIIALNAANGLFQNSLFGLASSFPFKYTNAILIGQNFCGIAVTVLAMATKAVTDDVEHRAMLYFGLSSIVIITCFVLLIFIKKLTFFKVFDVTEANEYDDNFKKEITTWEDVRIAFSESKAQFANIFLLFLVTLALFPNICMYVKDNKPGEVYGFIVPTKYFMDVTTFLNFNLFAFLGSLTANWIRSPGPKSIWIAVVARFWFLIYLPLANYQPEGLRLAPVLFTSTWFFVFNVTLLAFSSGYLSSLIMMYAPRCHEEPRIQRMAGMIAAFFLVAGVVAGLVLSWPIKLLILNYPF
uniref:Equilibrative nucleoside transporter n=1 Tax=Caenorhabditis tropicalis TaxID=1561998 RepID=A0A1I7TKX2_9PELO